MEKLQFMLIWKANCYFTNGLDRRSRMNFLVYIDAIKLLLLIYPHIKKSV